MPTLNLPMHYLVQFLLIVLATSSMFCSAALSNQNEIRYWQLFDNNTLSLNQVLATPDTNWTALPNGQTNLTAHEEDFWQAARGATMWIKVSLPRIIDTDKIWIELAPNVGLNGKMAIFENGIWQWKQAAGRQSSDDSNFPATFLTFAIENPRAHRQVYLKVNTSQVLNFSINIRDHDSQLSLLASRNLIYGLCLGLMLLSIVYYMVIGISANERVYIYYSSYVIGMTLYIIAMTGYNRLAFPEWGGDGSFTNLAACLAMFAATIFVREFLQTKTTIPKLDILLRLQSTALFITIFLLGRALLRDSNPLPNAFRRELFIAWYGR